MTTRLLTLVHSKVALAVLGVLLVGGSGAAVVAAAHSQQPTAPSASSNAHTPDATNSEGDHAHTVAIEGELTGYAAGHTITVQAKDSSKPMTVNVDANTRVDGEHATSLKDLAGAIGHDVEVQATKQSNGSLLAWKITVQGEDTTHGSDNGGDNGNKDDGQQHAIAGIITKVSASSFTVKLSSNSTLTVTVSGSTQFEGEVHSFGGLKVGMHVSVQGLMQSTGALAATRVEVQGTN